MGYIFDALNKQTGQPPTDDTSPVESIEDAVIDESPSTTTLADALDTALPMNEAEQPSLRLADLQHDIAPAVEDLKDFEANASDAIDLGLTIDVETDKTEPVALPTQTSGDGGGGGWWRWLMGITVRGKIDDRLVSMTSPASSVAEEYRSIRTSILARHDNQRNLVHTITSATPQEGKTITCVNLGLSFAELRNRKTVIIECDMRLPTFAKLLTCDPDKPGLIDYLRGEAALKDVIQQIDGSPLHIIPAGGRVSDEAVQLLSSSRMSQLIQGLRAKYDHVLIDTPPVLQLADAGILGSQSEEVLLVARMRRTPRTLVEQAVNTLASYNAVVNGIVATDNPRSRARGYGYKYGYRYGYGYGYGYTSDDSKKRRKKRAAA